MKFTFTARKEANGYNVTIKRNGVAVATVWSAGTKSEAMHEARVDAENYGFIDGL
jgi:hypothetical protein